MKKSRLFADGGTIRRALLRAIDADMTLAHRPAIGIVGVFVTDEISGA